MEQVQKVGIVVPLYNDWESLAELIKQIQKHVSEEKIELIVINDCSTQKQIEIETHFKLKVINLKINLGHQRAIAIGLVHCSRLDYISHVIVMDSDGEDNPLYINELLKRCRKTKKVTFARRSKRREGILFRLFYTIYKLIFKILTGESLSFGNFSAIPKENLDSIISIPDLWNHFSVAIMKSKIPYETIDTNREKRYFGKSKMNFNSLIIHGFSAISIFIENVLARIILTTLFVFVSSIALSGVVLYRKFVVGVASPGWATSTIFGFMIVSLLMLVFCFLIGLNYLNNRREQMDIDFLRDNYKKFTKE